MKNIELIRNQLNFLISNETSLTKDQIVEVSQKLDELINQYYNIKN